MSKYQDQNELIVVKKHFIVLFFRILRLLIVLMLLFIGYLAFQKYFPLLISDKSINYLIFLVIIVILNYEFIKLVLFLVKYYNNLIIITKDNILILNMLLVTKDDLEVIDPYKITKIDEFSRGFLSNVFGYGTLVIEQQGESVRKFRLTPNPYKIIKILHKQRQYIVQDRRKKYIINNEEI
ncbi:hypothetical protein CSB07_00555 [Candidatus Gracilibacteria bacterium]|nr:MAG: hypothetical protein CSB07_00555 [Candidatus Gracilibacteria bacterium]PIE85621.1 MAG: hypothetical protein CSA08_01025 [Candidatus Gracilibacteria bacterium]